jgi:NADH-quinone oxidoreductase subunit H
MGALFSLIFLGGWLPDFTNTSLFFILKILGFSYSFIVIRAAFPRYRYDQLMALGWKVFLPFTLAYFYLINIMTFIF